MKWEREKKPQEHKYLKKYIPAAVVCQEGLKK